MFQFTVLLCLTYTVFFVHSYSAIPEDLHRIETLQHFDMRLNRLKHSLPDVMEELPDLARLNISGNALSEVNTDHVKHLQQLNCSDNSLKILSVIEGPLKELAARNNSMYNQWGYWSIPTNLSKTKSGTKSLKKRDFWSKILRIQ